MPKYWLTRAAVLAALSFAIGACGSNDSDDEADATSTTSSVAEDAGGVDPLVGEWAAINECEQFVDALEEARLEEFAAKMAPGVSDSPPGKADPSDPCDGANPAEHSHSFSESGDFASFDDTGKKVDFGTYEITGEDTFTLSRPPFESEVRYQVDGDTATFDVVLPECEDKQCQTGAALGIATFFPQTYERVK